MKTLRALVAAGLVVASFGVAVAKLPPPPPLTEEQKKAAEEKKAKDAVAAEAAKAAQARAEDRVAARYFADMKAKGKAVRRRRWRRPRDAADRLRPCRRKPEKAGRAFAAANEAIARIDRGQGNDAAKR